MIVVDKKPIPIYETVCPECKSVIQYKKSEVSFTGYITCPICCVSVWGSTFSPKYYQESGEEDAVEVVRCEDCRYANECSKSVQYTRNEPNTVTIGYSPIKWCSRGKRRTE